MSILPTIIFNRTINWLLPAVLFAGGAMTAAQAQTNPAIGSWQCQTSYTEFNQGGARTSGFTSQYTIGLQPDGTFQVNGQQTSVAGLEVFQGQGRWKTEQDSRGILVGAQGVRTNRFVGQSQFFLTGWLLAQGQNISWRYELPWPNGSGIQNRNLMECRRVG